MRRAELLHLQAELVGLGEVLGALDGFLDCYEGSKLKGKVLAPGLYEKGAVKGTKYLTQAYNLGLKVK